MSPFESRGYKKIGAIHLSGCEEEVFFEIML
jgi:hypothetical protein